MSLVVLFIAALHAVPVVLIAVVSGSRVAVFVTACVSAAVGVLTGNPLYIAIDLIFVAFATYLTWPAIHPDKALTAEATRLKREVHFNSLEYKAKEDRWIFWITAFGVVGYLLYMLWPIPQNARESARVPTTAATPSIVQGTYVPAQRTEQANPVAPQRTEARKEDKPRPKRPAKTSLQKCLELPSDEQMARCLERIP